MNKSQLISAIAESAGITVAKAEETLQAALNGITDTLTQGGSVAITGFGSFGVKKRAARKVRNPRTGQEMMLKDTIVPYFKAGKNLKETVDDSATKK